eukprot:scaffold42680_cov18-Prasinocladus_malaysianus.AAC.2
MIPCDGKNCFHAYYTTVNKRKSIYYGWLEAQQNPPCHRAAVTKVSYIVPKSERNANKLRDKSGIDDHAARDFDII